MTGYRRSSAAGLILLVCALIVTGCESGKGVNADSTAADSSKSTYAAGGSASGDFGPPQGEPIYAGLTSAPNVPLSIYRDYPAKMIADMEVRELDMEISEGVTYTFWTFGGSVPGSFIRIRQGGTVEFYLKNNPDSKKPHNINLHAVTGPGGGATSSFTAPGHEAVFSFKALNPGLYVYQCITGGEPSTCRSSS